MRRLQAWLCRADCEAREQQYMLRNATMYGTCRVDIPSCSDNSSCQSKGPRGREYKKNCRQGDWNPFHVWFHAFSNSSYFSYAH